MPATSSPFRKRATAAGHYWESDRPVDWLRACCRGLDVGRFKAANIGGEQSQGFEQAFGSLAYAYLKDRAPRLLDFIVGFQLVDRNEDNTKAVAVFGFKVGEQWLYAPTFFLNGDLKGHELLYIKKQDAFVPLKENWINYLISRRPHVLGEGSPRDTFALGGLMPNLRRLATPPSSAKYGADAWRPDVDAWARPYVAGVCARAAVKHASWFAGTDGAAEALDLERFLAADFGCLQAAFDLYRHVPAVKAGFDRWYGGAAVFARCANALRAKAAAAPPARRPGGPSLLAGRVKAAVTIHVSDDVAIAKNTADLDDDERERLLRDTVLIKDERPDEAASVAYNTQLTTTLFNPTEGGLYDVLEKPGSFARMLVVTAPYGPDGPYPHAVVVRAETPRAWLNAHGTTVWARRVEEPAAFRDWVDGLPGADTLKEGGTYLAVGPCGAGTAPFTVRSAYGDGRYEVEYDGYVGWDRRRAEYLPPVAAGPRPPAWATGKMHVRTRPGCKIGRVGGEVYVPEDYKIVKLKDPPKPRGEGGSLLCGCGPFGASDDEPRAQPIEPGDIADVQLFLTKQAAALSVLDLGAGEVYVRSKRGAERMPAKAALVSLVRDHGLREPAARDVLKAAAAAAPRREAAAFLVKYADGYGGPGGGNLGPGPTAPGFPGAWLGTEPSGRSAVPSIYSQEEELPIAGMSAQTTDPRVYDPYFYPDTQTSQVAQEAATKGQKEVFDTAMVSTMLKAVRQDALVDRYLGDLMKALDKLGRILFMFYWHGEEFEDRYGKQDLPELEDSLRNAFEVLGDVVLFLKEKTVGTMQDLAGVGEPDIQEAARN